MAPTSIPKFSSYRTFRVAARNGSKRQEHRLFSSVLEQYRQFVIRGLQSGLQTMFYNIDNKVSHEIMFKVVKQVNKELREQGYKYKHRLHKEEGFGDYSISYVELCIVNADV